MPPRKIWDPVLEKALRSRLLPPLPPPPPPAPSPTLPPPPPPKPPSRWSTFGSDVSADMYTKTVKIFSGAAFCALGIVCTRVARSDFGEELTKKVKSHRFYRFLFPSKEVANASHAHVVDILVLQALHFTGPFATNTVKVPYNFFWGPGGIYSEVMKNKNKNETTK